MEKGYEKKRRKHDYVNDKDPKRKKSKHKNSTTEATIKHSNESPQAQEPAVLHTSAQTNRHSSKKPSKNKQPNAESFHKTGAEGSATTSSKPAPNHEASYERTLHSGDVDASAIASLNESVRQDREKSRKKRAKHGSHQADAENPLQQHITDGGNHVPRTNESESIQESGTVERRHGTKAKDENLDKHDQHNLERDGAAKDLASYDLTTFGKEDPHKRKKHRKQLAANDYTGEDKVQPQGEKVTARAPTSSPTLRYQEVLRETEGREDVNGDDIQHSARNDIASPKKKRRKNIVREELQHDFDDLGTSTISPQPISQNQETPLRKKHKRNYRSSQPEAESFSQQSLGDTPNPQDLRFTSCMPALDPSSASASAFFVQTSSLYLPLAPISQLHPLAGLCAEHLSPLILTYYTPFRGVVLSYSNPRLGNRPLKAADDKGDDDDNEQVLATSVDEYAAPFVWVTADFLLFRPKVGTLIEGWVILQNEGHIGLVCWNLFNASVGRNRIPKAWRWVKGDWDASVNGDTMRGYDEIQDENDGEEGGDESAEAENLGHFEDEVGEKIEGALTFRVKRVEVQRTWDREKGERCFISLEGSLLTVEEEEEATKRVTRKVGEEKLDRRFGNKEHSVLSEY